MARARAIGPWTLPRVAAPLSPGAVRSGAAMMEVSQRRNGKPRPRPLDSDVG
jgi:hypothetical protein